MTIEINDIDELQTLFEKAYLIESGFESLLIWDGYINVEEQNKNLLFTLAHDSEGHKNLIKELSTKIKGINLDEKLEDEKPGFDFGNAIDEVIFAEIIKNERLALDLYTKIHDLTNKDFIKEYWKGDDYNEYFKTFKWLMEEEKKHINLINDLIGNVELVGD